MKPPGKVSMELHKFNATQGMVSGNDTWQKSTKKVYEEKQQNATIVVIVKTIS